MGLFGDTTLEDFEKITGFDIVEYMESFEDFMTNQKKKVFDWYEGNVTSPDKDAFTTLRVLLDDSKEALQLFNLHKEEFLTSADWNLLDLVETMHTKLQTVLNFNLYLRSSILKNQFSTGTEIDVKINQNLTVENIVEDELASEDPQNDWIDVAIKNDLKEEDYTPKGGVLLQAELSATDNRKFLDSVIGNLQGENLYGKDIDRVITLVDNDIKVLSPKETMLQTIDINSELRRGDNPEFPDDGIQASAFTSNISGLGFPILFRQFTDLFGKDDTFSFIRFADVRFKEDNLFLDAEIQTKFGDVFKKNN